MDCSGLRQDAVIKIPLYHVSLSLPSQESFYSTSRLGSSGCGCTGLIYTIMNISDLLCMSGYQMRCKVVQIYHRRWGGTGEIEKVIRINDGHQYHDGATPTSLSRTCDIFK
jgi:hypothetical protein